MESSIQELLTKLQSEKDWHKSAIFTDKGEILQANKCTLLPDEIKWVATYHLLILLDSTFKLMNTETRL